MPQLSPGATKLVLGVAGVALIIGAVQAVVLCYRASDMQDLREELLKARVEASDKRRERDTCMKLNAELSSTVKCAEIAVAEDAEDAKEQLDYHEIFNAENAGIIATDIALYEMTDAELKANCNCNWKLNIGKNYPGAKLVSYNSFELSRSRSGTMYMVTCDWLVPSKLWCNKKAVP